MIALYGFPRWQKKNVYGGLRCAFFKIILGEGVFKYLLPTRAFVFYVVNDPFFIENVVAIFCRAIRECECDIHVQ